MEVHKCLSFVCSNRELPPLTHAHLYFYRFYSSSLLILYDADTYCEVCDRSIKSGLPMEEACLSKLRVDIRMIDFAHTVLHGDKSPDVGYVLGLHNLITLLNGLSLEELPSHEGDMRDLIILDPEAPIDKPSLLSRLTSDSKASTV